MKLALTLEADSVNVQALNMGQWRGENTRPEQKVILVVYFFVSGVG